MERSFNHSSSLRHDQRVMMLRMDYGMEGYGIYLNLRERLICKVSNSLEYTEIEKIAVEDNIDITLLQSVINTAISEGLFITDNERFWSYDRSYKKSKLKGRLYQIDVKLWYRIRKSVFERDNYTCSYCGTRGGKLEADHILPESRGGTNEMNNLTTACRKCNRQKKDRTPEEFAEWKGRRC